MLRQLAFVPRTLLNTPRNSLRGVFQHMKRAAAATKSKRLQARLAALGPKRAEMSRSVASASVRLREESPVRVALRPLKSSPRHAFH
jgi:hypothetical protein